MRNRACTLLSSSIKRMRWGKLSRIPQNRMHKHEFSRRIPLDCMQTKPRALPPASVLRRKGKRQDYGKHSGGNIAYCALVDKKPMALIAV